MPRGEPELLRDRVRTRRAVLEAAERAIAELGTKVSLATIAERAGVTKSGLMHHFPTREDLIAAVVEHAFARVWEEVRAHVDPGEHRPGSFTRGYVRAMTGGSRYLQETFSPAGLAMALGSATLTGTLAEDDARAWSEAFDADGLPPGRALVIRCAADGLVAAMDSPYLTPEQLDTARAELLAMTEVEPDRR